MEDAHIIHMRDAWGVFGVFDGHGGEACSKWIAQRFERELKENGCPKDDAAMKELFLRIDQEFLDTEQGSGTTATMCIVRKPVGGGKHLLHVINAGDSRVLLGRRNGEIVDGNGTDLGLTTDHKPNHPGERERIEANGGTVEIAAGGVARVNGDLAVSRGFGDAENKKQGKDPLNLELQPVTASPEMGHFECDESDFLLLVCDGVSEGDFSNAEVVELAAQQLREHGDPGIAATSICHRAVSKNSKDNVTCMMVLLDGSPTEIKEKTFNPGPLHWSANFIKAYEAMAGRAGYTLAQAVELRYEQAALGYVPRGTEEGHSPEKTQNDLDTIGEPVGQKGSEERAAWFQERVERLQQDQDGGGGDSDAVPDGVPAPLAALLRVARARGIGPDALRGQPSSTNKSRLGVRVRMPDLTVFKEAIEENSSLKWDARMEELALKTGSVEEDDESDGTTKVKFEEAGSSGGGVVAWIPTKILVEEGNQ